MSYATEPNPDAGCPKCAGPLWDNRQTKKNPKAPDYKCKDATCDGAIWPPKNGAPRPAAAAPTAKQGFTTGGHIPEIDGPYTETGAAPHDAPSTTDKLLKLFQVYDVCFDHAHSLANSKIGVSAGHEAIAAMTATLYISATNAGIAR